LIKVKVGMVAFPVTVLTPEMEAGTVVAFHVMTAFGVGDVMLTAVELAPEQMVWSGMLKFTAGAGFTVMVNVCTVPEHVTLLLMKFGVTFSVATMGLGVTLIAVNEGIFPVPDAAKPIPGVEFDQLYCVAVPTKGMEFTVPPLQITTLEGAVTLGVGFMVMVKFVAAPLQVIPPPVYWEVTVTVPDIAAFPGFVALKLATLVLPLAPKPIPVFEFVQA